MSLTVLEQAILAWFAVHAGNEALRVQCAATYALERTHTGPGQITLLHCQPSALAADFPTNCVPNAPLIESPMLPHGAGADLWLKNGRIDWLEIVAFGDAELPEEPFLFRLVDRL
jgi:hypothetical protein